MIESEQFYRRCWLTLKGANIKNARLRKQMDEIEVKVEGITVTVTPSPKKKSEETNGPNKTDKPEETVARL